MTAEAGGVPGPERVRLIQNEATTEIPVHLLFRDDDGAAGPGAPVLGLGPARQGSGEQPRVRSGEPVPGVAGERAVVRGERAVRRPAAGSGRPAVVGAGGAARPRPAGHGRRTPEAAARAVLPVDETLVERPAAARSGALAVAAGAAGLAGCGTGLWWAGLVPPAVLELARLPVLAGAQPGPAQWALLAGSGALALCSFGGLGRGRTGRAWVVSLFGRYRGSVRRTGLVWVNPFLKRRRVDVRLRHWRSEPLPAVDAQGAALRVVVLVVWRVQDTARATLGVEDHETYLRECVEAAMARVFSQLPADAFHGDGPTLRDAEAVGDALTRLLVADAGPAGLEVFSAQPTRIEYAPEVAEVMRRRRIAALDLRHRESVLTQVVDSVEDTVTRLTMRGLVELDDYERKALVKDLTVAFYTGHGDR
ncbi:SPFH domain-containing protein [Streptomyces indicus]|uniref:SPFH domain / Band 7 family protein n=1 Tax=Streptomyces indicus TaxID=417292 RepID=A0A1G9DSF2_9ACTN|nr:SPFH domain-containing protein [Streptomyces indicus]SDK66786.1 SPFH domain / Band 7 family protein [Streptomyces indicus]